jgi:hypothetical protein
MFSKNMRTFYLYVVSFVTLLMTIGGLIGLIGSVTNLLVPDKYVESPYKSTSYYDYSINEYVEYDTTSEEYLKENKEKIKIEEENIRNEKIRNIIYSSSFTLISGIIFMYHWSKISKDLKNERSSE